MAGTGEIVAWIVGILIFVALVYLYVTGKFSPGAIDPLAPLIGG